jgi:integrase
MNGLQRRFAQISTILMLCLRDSGARPKELCVGWWGEWEKRPDGWSVLTLPWWKHKTGRKTGKDRVIALPPHCTRRIEWIRGLEGRHPDHIFTHRRGRGRVIEGETTAEAGDPWVAVDPTTKRIGNTKGLQKWFNRLRKEAIAAGIPIDPKFRLYFHRSSYSTEGQRKGVSRGLLADAMGTSERMLERNYTDLVEEDVLDVAKAVAKRTPEA